MCFAANPKSLKIHHCQQHYSYVYNVHRHEHYFRSALLACAFFSSPAGWRWRYSIFHLEIRNCPENWIQTNKLVVIIHEFYHCRKIKVKVFVGIAFELRYLLISNKTLATICRAFQSFTAPSRITEIKN